MMRLRDLRGRHALAAVWLAGVLDAAMPVAARDLGVLGETWRIAEADLLDRIEQQLVELERSGERARLDEEAKARARERLEAPEPVPGIEPARVSRVWLFDPAITVQENIVGPDGTVIAAAGTRIEPLAHRPLLQELLFIDGTRAKWRSSGRWRGFLRRRSCSWPGGRSICRGRTSARFTSTRPARLPSGSGLKPPRRGSARKG